TTGFRCVQCGSPVEALYIQYSPGNIRLSKCGNCKSVADEYVECEMMILVIDLILHKPKAYRHVYFNVLSRGDANLQSLLWKLVLTFIFLDLYKAWKWNAKQMEWPSTSSLTSFSLEIGTMLIHVVFRNITFLYFLLHSASKFLREPAGLNGWKQMMVAILLSSYFKMFLVAMMVWEMPSSMIFIVEIFVLSSNVVAIEVMTNSGMVKSIAVCG
ncbi:hypothetical protein M569_12973, partial [Genlisea aurea]